MKKRLIALLLCALLTVTPFAAVAESEERSNADEKPNATANTPLAGDTNGDGKVSASDASLVLRYCVGLGYTWLTVSEKIRADVNRDYTVDASDAAAILRQVVGLSTLKALETLDQTLYANLMKQNTVGDMTEWITYFIQRLPAGDRRKVLYAGATYLGTPYGKKDGQLDCSAFCAAAYRDAGVSKDVYPQRSSQGTIDWYTNTQFPERQKYFHRTDDGSWRDWKPGDVLIYVNSSTGDGSHLALYVGEIGGVPYVMESRRNPVDGVRLGELMYSSSSWNLVYYVDPLG